MKKRIVVSLIALMVAFMVPVTTAGGLAQIEGWASLREDTKMIQGAFENTVCFNAFRTYIPGVGVVFVMDAPSSLTLEQAQKEFEKALKYIVPTIEALPDDELVVLSISVESYSNEWEVVYMTEKADAANPDAWTVYYNERATW
jgi:hypothetical protein